MATAPNQPSRTVGNRPAANAGAVVKREDTNVTTIKQLLGSETFRTQMAAALPKHCDPERQLRIALTTINKTPALAKCTQESLFAALLDCSQMGLEPDGYYAHLIPYGNQCKLIVDYKGLVELVNRAGTVDFIDAVCVFERDDFRMKRGTEPKIDHEPFVRGDRGALIGAYCVAHVKGAKFPKFEFMPKEEIDAIRKRSPAGGSGPWVTDYNEMSKKTVLRRLSKTIPKSAELRAQLDKDLEHDGDEEIRMRNAKPMAVVADLPTGDKQTEPAAIDVESSTAGTGEQSADQAAQDELARAEAEANKEAEEAQKKVAARKVAQEEEEKRKAAEAARAAAAPKAPAQPAATTARPSNPAPVTLPAPSDSDVPNLRVKIAEHGVTEKQVCGLVMKKYRVPACDTLEEIADLAPKRVTLILFQFDALLAELKTMPQ